jgi:hypothetical protein
MGWESAALNKAIMEEFALRTEGSILGHQPKTSRKAFAGRENGIATLRQ